MTVDGRGRGGAASFAVKELDKRRLASVFVGSDRKRTLLDQARAESELQSLCACENVVEAYVWVNDASSTQVRLVMEHCERGSIVDDEAETFEPFDSEKIKIILRSILRALRTCHKRDVVHYDIKPQNVFETSDGTYKLGDFGCACEVERDKKTGERELVSKTPGTPAFTALSAARTYQKILTHRVDFTEIDKEATTGFSDLMRRLLEPDPAKRLSASRALLHPWFPQEPARVMSSTPRPALRWYQRPFRWLRMKFAKRKKGKDGAAAERK
ncbi:kinase-like domain-containing protein [Ostreococcus tauri]|uniref:Kinase-like domain-containing protein n=1 Tax=Ostreococcus tauri TaxID=70448 RepID=A0A1Y5I840_OSTTA|nr:kinase-like domain-containing protein [Ostreococcus tauri]